MTSTSIPAIFLFGFAALPVLLFAHAEGPDPGYSGVPGEQTCAGCHTGAAGSGSVTVTFPSGLTYTPGVAQQLVVTVADTAQKRWGFQLTARQSSSSTAQAGTFTPGSDGYTQLACTTSTFRSETLGSTCSSSLPLQYIEHTLAGTRNGTAGSVAFSFTWTPPSTNVGNVVLYVAGNAANGDGNDTGDHIYTAGYTLAPAASNAPSITSVTNAAGYQASIAPAAWATIAGTNLANSTRTWTTADIVNGALPAALDGVSVTIDGKAAYVYYISPTQLNVQVPSGTTTGPVGVVVTNNGSTAAASVDLEPVSPAFFVWSGKYTVATTAAYGYVAATGLISGVTTAPAKPGDVIILWGTGFGDTTPSLGAGVQAPSTQFYSVTTPPAVTVGNVPAQVIGAALSPGSAGLYQIVIEVPGSLANGDQAVVATVSGVQSPAGVYVTVQN